MKKDEAKQLCDNAMAELSAALAAGKSEELTKYLATMSTFHNYSFGNCMLIARQRPDATQVAGFQAWKKHDRMVRKGEKGICILAPLVGKKEDDDGNEVTGVFGYKVVHVFDVSQTEGEDMPDISRVSGDPGEKLLKLTLVTKSFDITLSFEDDLGGADGVSRGGSIVLQSGLSAAETFNTLAHEMAHELMHRGEERASLSKSVKELEAESVAFVVSKAAGLEGALKQSSDYIQCHQGDAEQLSKSLLRIQKTASLILTELESVSLEPYQVGAIS